MSTDRFLLRPWLALLAAACAPALGAPGAARSPDQADMDRVARREAAVVLLRVTATIDGKRVDLARAYDGNRLPRFYLASLDGLDAPKRVSPATPARASAEDDWRYLVLSPGTYFLLVLPPGAEQNPPAVAYSAQQGRYGRLTRYELKPGRGAFYSPELGYVFAASCPTAGGALAQGRPFPRHCR